MTFAATHPDLTGLYERLAPGYDRMHRRWLRHAGGEAQAALEAAIRLRASPRLRILDAGCGTGAFARRLLEERVVLPGQMTLLDPSGAMLNRCADMPFEKTRGRLEGLPFKDESFDLVTCAWALETAAEPTSAIREMHRVLRPGGLLYLAFCADQPAQHFMQHAMRVALSIRGTGRFLSREAVRSTLVAAGAKRIVSVPVGGPVAVLFAWAAD